MCLETVKKTYNPPKKVSSAKGNFKIGYKALHQIDSTSFCGPWYGRYVLDKWIYSDSEGSKEFGGNVKYEPGFHIFTSLKAADKYAASEGCSVFRVQYNDVVAEGTQYVDDDIEDCVVARRMRVFKKDKVK